ncbi:hypothetical protein SUGI_0498540 [Cryptomeria japonica]|uniref:uncharacterized protein LOC131063121 n=1 Tax=Cryptomeria japonica TaxID=3369 RepID=UPI002408EDF6|nr:uncharacterized protein LOC131063121 [Cryptomeria japonica]GLJ25990.1 hypothetical protein SUGI_0498540 [Cryptomeria japonica]
MKNLMRGSRCEKRISTDGLSADEALGPKAAIPFKWEEAPGKAKPKEEGELAVPHIKQDGELYNQLLCKGDSMGHSSGSLYSSIDAGSIPFEWEEEPGKPKTPARDEGMLPLNPPPALQSPDRIGSPFRASASPVRGSTSRRWHSQNLMKWMFHNQRNKVPKDSNSGTVKTHISVSQELGSSKSSRISEFPASFLRAKSSHGRLEFTSKISSSSNSSQTESGRIGSSRRGYWWSLHTSNNKSSNLCNPNPTEHHISDEQNAAEKGADLAQKSKDDNDENLASEGEESLDFHDVIAEILKSEVVKEEMKSTINNGDKKEEVTLQRTAETNMELEIMMRFAQINVGKKKIVQRHAYKISDAAQPGGFFHCLPLCLFAPRRAKIYEDCMDSITSHYNAVSKSNLDLERGF